MLRARAAAKDGRQVTLIGFGKGGTSSEEDFGAGHLTVIRLKAVEPKKSIIIRRSLWTLGMIIRLVGATWSAARRQSGAEIKVTGAPPFFAYAFLLANAVTLRRPVTYRMTDFYPETAFAAGRGLWLRPFAFVFRWTRRLARRIEVLSEDQKRRLAEKGFPEGRITLERDWSPVDLGGDIEPAQKPFGPEYVTLLYSGNLGVAHEIATFCEAYRRHVHEGANKVRLWLNARGVGVARLAEYCADYDLPIHVSEPVGLDQLAGVLKAADAHLILLGAPFWGYVFPSKVYAAVETRKPIIYVGPPESDVAVLCAEHPGNICAANDDVDSVVKALDALSR